jgi:hypothetical protein
VARGFESKDVEFQQEEAGRRRRSAGPARTGAERETESRQRTLRLALSNARAELAAATNAIHRRMLAHKIEALERQLPPDA